MSTLRDSARPNEPRGPDSAILRALLAGLDKMCGNSQFSLLGDIVAVARSEFGFTGTLEEAHQALQAAPALEIEPAADLDQTRVRRVSA